MATLREAALKDAGRDWKLCPQRRSLERLQKRINTLGAALTNGDLLLLARRLHGNRTQPTPEYCFAALFFRVGGGAAMIYFPQLGEELTVLSLGDVDSRALDKLFDSVHAGLSQLQPA